MIVIYNAIYYISVLDCACILLILKERLPGV